jgi:uncharacterized protein YndB with AHSA1/START domain
MVDLLKRQMPFAVAKIATSSQASSTLTVAYPSQSKDLIMALSTNTALDQWALDREIVLSRVISARRDVVFSAWTDARHLPNWFGPADFEIETKEIDIRVGGLWRFDMVAPNGRRFTNRMIFRRIERPTLIEFDHGTDDDDDPGQFRTTITFDEQSDGKTVITLRQLHPTKAQRDAGIGFGAVEYGYQTLEKLARHVESLHA